MPLALLAAPLLVSACVSSGGIGTSDPFARSGDGAQATGERPGERSGGRAPLGVEGLVTGGPEDTPVGGAEVSMVSADGEESFEARADSAGTFRFDPAPQGLYTLRASAAGHQSLEIQVALEGLPPVRLEVQLALEGDDEAQSTAQLLGRADPLQTAGFYDRRNRESGSFLLAADIRRRGIGSPSELVLTLPGFRPSPTNATVVVGRRGCPPTLFVDGLDVGDLRQIDFVVSLWGISAMEAYPGSSPPAVFAGLNSQCGAVAIWTPRGA
jgi:hypothetical protein